MEKVRYMISDAAHIAGVESHVLRYWEDELDLAVPRNELGHRYYTRENIQEFQKIKELKEQGYQLKAIRAILHGEQPPLSVDEAGPHAGASPIPETAPIPGVAPIPAGTPLPGVPPLPATKPDRPLDATALREKASAIRALSAEERMDQFRELMSDIVGRAIAQNNEELSLTIGQEVEERVLKEMNYLMREQENAAEERYKRLDAAIRGSVRRKHFGFAKHDKADKQATKAQAVPAQ